MTTYQARELNLPPLRSTGIPASLTTFGPVVVVGANGSGKSRFGAWIEAESTQRGHVHRISAQKSLSMPESVPITGLEEAERALWYGYASMQTTVDHRANNRWGGKPATFLLNDFDKLISYLFSEEAEVSINYRLAAKKPAGRKVPSDTKLDTLKAIWHQALPHRTLLTARGKVSVQIPGSPQAPYVANELSDGERVILYLIGECLAAPQSGIIVVDEPEIHLHKSIQFKLWNAIENARPDCLFVYLTHDLDFAASRLGATKIWIKDYDGTTWDWSVLPELQPDSSISEDIFLTILGSRKPVLFVEGEITSWDYAIYSHIYQQFTIVPCGSCTHVINATGSFTAQAGLHHLACYGIIDRDFRTAEQIAYLKNRKIFVLEFSEVENLFLAEDALEVLATNLHITDKATTLANIKSTVLSELQRDKTRVASSIVAVQVETALTVFDNKAVGESALAQSLNALTTSIDIPALYGSAEATLSNIIAASNYSEAIKLYNNKGLLHKVAPLLGWTGEGFISYLKSLLASNTNDGTKFRAVVLKNAPKLPIV